MHRGKKKTDNFQDSLLGKSNVKNELLTSATVEQNELVVIYSTKQTCNSVLYCPFLHIGWI